MKPRQIFLFVSLILVFGFAAWKGIAADLNIPSSPWLDANHWKVAIGFGIAWILVGPLKMFNRK